VVPKVCFADRKGYATSSQGIHGYTDVTTILKFTYLLLKGKYFVKSNRETSLTESMFISYDRLNEAFCTHEVNDSQFNYGQIMQCIVTQNTGMYS
jgi:hypothetical protein